MASGVPEPVVRALLSGQPAGEPDVQARFLQRLDLLRRTRLKPNGRKYTQQEIADGAGMSRQQAGALINGDRRPTMEHCDAIQRFFRVHAGFLTAEDPEALASALQRTEQELLQKLADRERGGRGGRRPAGAAAAGPRGARHRLAGRAAAHRPAPRQGRGMAGHAPGERQAARVLTRGDTVGIGGRTVK